MNNTNRWNEIKKMVEQHGEISAADVVTQLGISPATARRDFIAMEKKGLLVRFHGGIRPINHDAPKVDVLRQRILDDNKYKRVIAQKASEFILDHDFIYMDTSSTVFYMLDYIKATDIMVVTNSYLLVPRLVERDIRTYVLGGFAETVGNILSETSSSQIASMHFNKAFLGVYGFSNTNGLSGYNPFEAELKKQIITQCSENYALADHTKFTRHGFYHYASADAVTIITDHETPVELLSKNSIVCSDI